MSLITRCPACTTMFKVVPDQLRVSDGWVRCGQCNEVFDANANLQPELAVDSTPEAAPPPPEPSAVAPAEPSPQVVAEPERQPVVARAPVSDPFLAVNPHALHIEPEPLPHEMVREPELYGDAADAPAVSPDETPQADDNLMGVDETPAHSFMQSGRPPSVWARRSVRLLLSLASLFLLAALLVQVTLSERDRIAAIAPGARVFLDPLCDVVGCTLAPLRQIESVVIESSSFTKVRADVYRLSVTLKNTAQLPVATPALELTLTDMQDQAVIRRVLLATDLGDKSAMMEPGSELHASLPLSVRLAGNAERISGYRLLSFYP